MIRYINEYSVPCGEINTDNLDLSGNLDLSSMSSLTRLSCSGNSLTGVDVLGCSLLAYLVCNTTGINDLNISNCPSLSIVECENNYLNVSAGTELMNALDIINNKEMSRTNYANQKISADKSLFSQVEYDILSVLAQTGNNITELGWDLNKPGEWSGVSWEMSEGTYRVNSIDFQYKKVAGELDLSSFNHLTSLYCAMTNLTSVSLPTSLQAIADETFYDCDELIQVIVPDGITTIGEDAFFSCEKLWDVKLGNDVAVIGAHAFRSCTNLQTIVIPASVTKVDYNAFWGCKKLQNVIFMGNAPSIFDLTAFEGTHDDFCIYYCQGKTGFAEPKWNDYDCKMLTDNILAYVSLNSLYKQSSTITGKLSVDVLNISSERTATITIGVYSQSKKLIYVKSMPTELNTGTNRILFSDISIPNANEDSYDATVFIWDGFVNVTPLENIQLPIDCKQS